MGSQKTQRTSKPADDGTMRAKRGDRGARTAFDEAPQAQSPLPPTASEVHQVGDHDVGVAQHDVERSKDLRFFEPLGTTGWGSTHRRLSYVQPPTANPQPLSPL